MLVFVRLAEELDGFALRVADRERIVECSAAVVVDDVRVGTQGINQVKNTFIRIGLRRLHQRCNSAAGFTLD